MKIMGGWLHLNSSHSQDKTSHWPHMNSLIQPLTDLCGFTLPFTYVYKLSWSVPSTLPELCVVFLFCFLFYFGVTFLIVSVLVFLLVFVWFSLQYFFSPVPTSLISSAVPQSFLTCTISLSVGAGVLLAEEGEWKNVLRHM